MTDSLLVESIMPTEAMLGEVNFDQLSQSQKNALLMNGIPGIERELLIQALFGENENVRCEASREIARRYFQRTASAS